MQKTFKAKIDGCLSLLTYVRQSRLKSFLAASLLWLQHRHLNKQTACWSGLPAHTTNLLHQLSTTKNGATYQTINTRGTGQKKLFWSRQILPPLPVFCVWVISATFHFMWTNGEAHFMDVEGTKNVKRMISLLAITSQF